MSEKKPKKLEQVFAEEAGSNPSPSWETFEPGDGSQNATASIGHWHDFNGAGPAYEPGELKEQIEANTEAIAANRVLIDQNTVDTQQDHQQITANTEAIEVNSHQIELLKNRVKEIEEWLGAVEVNFSLGTGKWIYDSETPPTTSHFYADSANITQVTEFKFNEASKDAAQLQWKNTRVGDKLFASSMNDSANNHGDFEILQFQRYNSQDVPSENGNIYYFKVSLIAGTGKFTGGQQAECSISRVVNQFTPPEDPDE